MKVSKLYTVYNFGLMYALHPMVPYKSKDKQQQKIAIREDCSPAPPCVTFTRPVMTSLNPQLLQKHLHSLYAPRYSQRHAAAIQAW